MTDELQNSEVQEVATQVEPTSQENNVIKAKQEAADRNWRAMRLKNEELEKRLRDKDELFDKMMQQQIAASTPKPQPDEFDSIGDDEFIPKGKVQALAKKEAQKYAEEIAKHEVAKYMQKQNDSQFLDRLNRQYSDFSDIVNPETLSLLEETEPELAKTMADLKDPYKIGVQSYKYIKAMGLVNKTSDSRREKEIEKKIEKNEKAVQSPVAFDKRPMAQAFKMTDAMKKELYNEMMGYANMASGVPEMS